MTPSGKFDSLNWEKFTSSGKIELYNRANKSTQVNRGHFPLVSVEKQKCSAGPPTLAICPALLSKLGKLNFEITRPIESVAYNHDLSSLMGLPYITSAKFSDFLPPPSLCPNFLYCLSTNSRYCFTPFPLCADVIYGSPISLIVSDVYFWSRKFVKNAALLLRSQTLNWKV